ncbi:hypothetical protein KAI46_02855 [bacterium]|nr:hypothetical protein [bacterium]
MAKKSSFYPFVVSEGVVFRFFVVDWHILATEILSAQKAAFKGKVSLSA